MKEVTKEEFKNMYFRFGRGPVTGWDTNYWNTFFEEREVPGMKYFVQEPETTNHKRMMITTDHGQKEHHMFFMTEEDEERFFEHPSKD